MPTPPLCRLNCNRNAREDAYKVTGATGESSAAQRPPAVRSSLGAKQLQKPSAADARRPRVRDSRGGGGGAATRCRAACVRAASAFVSTVGLSLLVAGYSCLGGVVFEWLERENELLTKESARQVVAALRKLHAADLYATAAATQQQQQQQSNGSDSGGDTVLRLSRKLRELSGAVFALIAESGWDGTDESSGEVTTDWAFPGALLFSVTTITTIGYGFIAPVTTTGRIICIFYSIFGLPITMLAIANIGLWLARQVRKIYGSIEKLARRQSSAGAAAATASADAGGGDDAGGAQEVPVLFSLVIMMAYIFLGAVLFAEWENWSLSDGAYFSFVTLATIGYGDLVPGVYSGKGDWVKGKSADALKLVICGVYLFVGLSLLAMCMDLMKEEVSANFMWLGYKTGIIKQRKPEEVIARLRLQQRDD